MPNERRPHTSQSHTSAEIGIAHSALFSFCVSILRILGSLSAVGFGMQPPQPFSPQNKTKKALHTTFSMGTFNFIMKIFS